MRPPPPNVNAHLPGRLQDLGITDTENPGPVRCGDSFGRTLLAPRLTDLGERKPTPRYSAVGDNARGAKRKTRDDNTPEIRWLWEPSTPAWDC